MLIERSDWTGYFAELTRQADGYATTIELLSGELGDQIEVRNAPLTELAFDPREGISVTLGDTIRHVIDHPLRVEATDDPGVPTTLMVEQEDGTKTLVRLAAPEP